MRVLIVGGGIAGLTCARFLKNQGIDVRIIDHAPEFLHIGYVISVWSIGRKILQKLGVEDVFLQKSHSCHTMTNLDKEGNVLKEIAMGNFIGSIVTLERASLHEILIEVTKDVPIQFDTTIRALHDRGGSIEAQLSDGTKQTFDLIVGADGIESKVRELAFGPCNIHYYGFRGAICWVKNHASFPDQPFQQWGDGKMVWYVPFGNTGRTSLGLGIADRHGTFEQSEGNRVKRLQELFGDFGGVLPNLFSNVEEPEHIFYSDFQDISDHEWGSGRVALIGDSAHAMMPHTGFGASLAMEDAYVLAEELQKVSVTEDVPRAVQKYAERRAPRVYSMREASLRYWRFISKRSKGSAKIRDILCKALPASSIIGRFRRLVNQPI